MFAKLVILGAQLLNPGDLLSDLGLDGAGHTWIADAEQAAGWRAGGKPVTTGQSLYQRLKMDLQVDRGVLLGDLSQGLHGFVSDDRLLHCGKALQGRLHIKKRGSERSDEPPTQTAAMRMCKKKNQQQQQKATHWFD